MIWFFLLLSVSVFLNCHWITFAGIPSKFDTLSYIFSFILSFVSSSEHGSGGCSLKRAKAKRFLSDTAISSWHWRLECLFWIYATSALEFRTVSLSCLTHQLSSPESHRPKKTKWNLLIYGINGILLHQSKSGTDTAWMLVRCCHRLSYSTSCVWFTLLLNCS